MRTSRTCPTLVLPVVEVVTDSAVTAPAATAGSAPNDTLSTTASGRQ